MCSAFLTGCSKNEATEAVKESTEDENEGTGDTKDADSKKDTNRKSDKQDSDKSDENSEESETTEAPEENLDKVGVLASGRGRDINSSLERTELKSRLKRQVMKLLCILPGTILTPRQNRSGASSG